MSEKDELIEKMRSTINQHSKVIKKLADTVTRLNDRVEYLESDPKNLFRGQREVNLKQFMQGLSKAGTKRERGINER